MLFYATAEKVLLYDGSRNSFVTNVNKINKLATTELFMYVAVMANAEEIKIPSALL